MMFIWILLIACILALTVVYLQLHRVRPLRLRVLHGIPRARYRCLGRKPNGSYRLVRCGVPPPHVYVRPAKARRRGKHRPEPFVEPRTAPAPQAAPPAPTPQAYQPPTPQPQAYQPPVYQQPAEQPPVYQQPPAAVPPLPQQPPVYQQQPVYQKPPAPPAAAAAPQPPYAREPVYAPEPAAPTGGHIDFEAQAEPRQQKHRPSRKSRRSGITAVLVCVNLALVACIIVAALRGGLGSQERVEVDQEAQQAQQAEQQETQQSQNEPATEPAEPADPGAAPLRPASNLGDGGEYVEGTWMNIELQDSDVSSNPNITIQINDEGTGQQIYFQDQTPVDQDSKLSYCFENPGRYIVTAYVTSNGVQSEYLVMNIKIYMQV